MFLTSNSARQQFSSGSFPVELVLLIAKFLPEKNFGVFLQLSKAWLDLLIKMKSSEYRSAVLQCLVLMPNKRSLDRVYQEACLTATTLSCHWNWTGSSSDSKYFIRSSEIYANALARFFQKKGGAEAYDHLRIMSSELYPSLKKYPSGKARKLTLGILKERAPHLLLGENDSSCAVS